MSSYYDVDAILTDAQVTNPLSSLHFASSLTHNRPESTMHLRAHRTRSRLSGRQHVRRHEAGVQSGTTLVAWRDARSEVGTPPHASSLSLVHGPGPGMLRVTWKPNVPTSSQPKYGHKHISRFLGPPLRPLPSRSQCPQSRCADRPSPLSCSPLLQSRSAHSRAVRGGGDD